MNQSAKFLARAAIIAVLTMATAQASVVFTVKRVSDKSATITASGSLDGSTPSYAYLLGFDKLLTGISTYENAYAIGPGSTMQVGGNALDFAYTAGPGHNTETAGSPAIYAGASTGIGFHTGDAVTGQLVLSLANSAGSFVPTGSTGNVYWGAFGSSTVIGSYSIVDANAAVPEPASLALIGCGLLAAGAARRSRRRA